MGEIDDLLEMLNSGNPNRRFEACELMLVASAIPQEALVALRAATADPDPSVADAATRALSIHVAAPHRVQPAAAVQPSSTTPPASPHPIRRLILISAAIAGITSAIVWCAGAWWITFLPGQPPDTAEAMGYLAGLYICVASPLIALLTALFTYLIETLVARVHLAVSRRLIAILFGLAFGIGFSLGPIVLFLQYCDPISFQC